MGRSSGSGNHDPRSGTLWRAIERIPVVSVEHHPESDTLVTRPFVQRHTQFESFAEFCAASPCEGNDLSRFQQLSFQERDNFVDRTTDFEDWAEMKRTAAIEDLLDHAPP